MTYLFWCTFLLLIYIYFGYYGCLWMFARFFPKRLFLNEANRPSMTILFSAHNERVSLPKKLESIDQLDYPKDRVQVLATSDASTDGTFECLNQHRSVEAFEMREQCGKNQALNRVLSYATGDILFFTDANTQFHPDALSKVARHFNDSRVGVVFGQLIYSDPDEWTEIGRGTAAYWHYENNIKHKESELGSLLVGGGSLLAVRRDLMTQLDPRIANDLEIPMRLGAKGYCIIYEPDCLGFEKPHATSSDEINRTMRIVSRGMRGFISLLPVTLKSPFRLWQFISHKLLRWFTLPIAIVMMVAAFTLGEQWFPTMAFYLGLFGFGGGMIGMMLLQCHSLPRIARPFTMMGQMLLMHIGATAGVLRAFLGKTPAIWTIPHSSRKES